jgi:phage terminase small subunit
MNARQKRFCDEYIIDLNGTQAAIRAGYSEKTAQEQASQLLLKLIIQDEIKKILDSRSTRTEIRQDAVLKELAKLGFSNMLDFIITQPDGSCYTDLSKLTRNQAAAISEITTEEYTEGRGDEARIIKKIKLKLYDKTKPLELLGKHLGMFSEKHEITGDLKIQVTFKDD